MATTKLADGALTVSFIYTADADVVIEILSSCAEHLWKEETPFSEATNAQKLDVVDEYVKNVLIDLANSHKVNKAQRLAREAEEATKFSL